MDSYKNFKNKDKISTTCNRTKNVNLKLLDKVRHTKIREKTKVADVNEYISRMKWKWAGHVARIIERRWTKLCTDWKSDRKKRIRPKIRLKDEITQTAGEEWTHQAADRDQWSYTLEAHVQHWTDSANK